MNIFFDLDGTLLDSMPRLHRLFQDLVPQSSLTFNAYWELKRNKISHKELLNTTFKYSEQDILSFQKQWMDKIEQPEWLALDKPFKGVVEYLQDLKKNHNLYVVTARQFKDAAVLQIQDAGIFPFFKEVLVTNQTKEKHELIKETVTVSTMDWMVGDTGKDVQTGKLLGIRTAAVLSGFLNEKCLLGYNPDIIVATVLDLKINN